MTSLLNFLEFAYVTMIHAKQIVIHHSAIGVYHNDCAVSFGSIAGNFVRRHAIVAVANWFTCNGTSIHAFNRWTTDGTSAWISSTWYWPGMATHGCDSTLAYSHFVEFKNSFKLQSNSFEEVEWIALRFGYISLLQRCIVLFWFCSSGIGWRNVSHVGMYVCAWI